MNNKPLPEIERCAVCGYKAETFGNVSYGVYCSNSNCWLIGPTRKTDRGAITIWNTLMRAYRERRK